MGYETRIRGEIRIDPPIPADELRGSGFVADRSASDITKDVALYTVEQPIEGVPGAYGRVATAIVPVMSSYSAYEAVEHTQEIINRWGEGRTFTGRLDCSGQERGDLWRLEVHDGRAVEVRPRIVWPDGSEEEAR
jgi:hypothetical protein